MQSQSTGDALNLKLRAIAHIARANWVLSIALAALLAPQHAIAQFEDVWEIHMQRGIQAAAESRLDEARSRFEAAVRESEGQSDPDRASTSLIALGDVLRLQGEIPRAIATVRRAQLMVERIPGLTHNELAVTLNNLAGLYDLQGQLAEAETLYLRALEIREKHAAHSPNDVVALLNNIGSFYHRMGENARAESFFRRALTVLNSGAHIARETQIALFSNLALSYELSAQVEQAENALTHAIQIAKETGSSGVELATAQHNLGNLKLRSGASSQARALLESALATRRSTLGAEHTDVALTLFSLAGVASHDGDIERALALSREGARILRLRLQRLHRAHNRWALAEQRSWVRLFQLHLGLLHQWSLNRKGVDATIVAEAFESMQLARASDTGHVVLGMAARFASGTDELAGAVRSREDTLVALHTIGEQLTRAEGLDEKSRTATQRRLRAELEQAEKRLAATNQTLAQRFPQFEALTSNAPVGLASAQQLLRPSEALLSLTVADGEGFAVVLTSRSAHFVSLKIGRREVERLVATLRRQLDPESAMAAGGQFPVGAAYTLYQRLLEPLSSALEGIKHLIVVPDSAIDRLPLNVLITKASPDNGDLAAQAWLARRFAVSFLPSVGAIRSLRAFVSKPPGELPLVAFADPLLSGDQQPSRNFGVRAVFKESSIADVRQIQKLARLPETAQEALSIADALKADRKYVFLGEDASETRVKSLDLSRFRNILFATHGLMSGDISALAEPALVLTPPAVATDKDDGILTAGEIAKLRLNADWVILSACNTAAADGSGAEGFSGLARAFFYAGARALLVSHWAVESNSTVELTTALFREFVDQPAIGKAESLRLAIIRMLEKPSDARFKHPMFWAPFVLVGDGAAPARSAGE